MQQKMVINYGHATGDGQKLQTCNKRWAETIDMLPEMVRDCKQDTRCGQRL